jgi:L-fuconolactonase
MYRATGPVEWRSLGETEFANGIAAMSASGNYGACRVASGIMAYVDLRLGDRVRRILEAHIAAAGPRLKGVRNATAWDAYPVMGVALDPARSEWLMNPNVPNALAALGSLGLVFESWIFHTQLSQLARLADACPTVTIVLGHLGTPILTGPYASRRNAVFSDWKRGILELSRRPNIVVKLGGLGMSFVEPGLSNRKPQAGSAELARHWQPYLETCIESFGAQRCMFESNFPPDRATCSYGTLWNVFKRIAARYSAEEKAALFSGTARRVFRIEADAAGGEVALANPWIRCVAADNHAVFVTANVGP